MGHLNPYIANIVWENMLDYSMLAYESVKSCDLGIHKVSKCYGLIVSLILVSVMLT